MPLTRFPASRKGRVGVLAPKARVGLKITKGGISLVVGEFLGKRFGAQREITTREFMERVEGQSRADILVYQLDTCWKCLGELEVSVKGGKTTHKCKNCSFSISNKTREEEVK